MGSYSKSIVQDLRTVVEGAETVASPESVLTQPLSTGISAKEWIQGLSISQVMPGAIQAGGAVTVQEVSKDIVDRVLQSSDESLNKILQSTDVQLARSDLWTEELVNTILKAADKQADQAAAQAKQAIAELGEVTGSITAQKKAETEIISGISQQIPKAVIVTVISGIILFYIYKKGK